MSLVLTEPHSLRTNADATDLYKMNFGKEDNINLIVLWSCFVHNQSL